MDGIIMEIERKFLLNQEVPSVWLNKFGIYPDSREITQVYLPNGLRVRSNRIPGVRVDFTLNLKAPTEDQIARKEWEGKIPEWVFKHISSQPEAKKINKWRLSWTKDGLKFDLDKFYFKEKRDYHNILEIEFPDVETAIAFDPQDLPFSNTIEKEVTYNSDYQNYNIAMARG